MRKILLLLVAVLIAFPAANAIGQPGPTLNVAIVKCVENNTPGTAITVFATDTTFPPGTLPATCTVGTTHSCAACLRDLAHDFQCRGGSTFTSNTETVQPTVSGVPGTSINKFVFACGPAAP
jgi:hypothetical protein